MARDERVAQGLGDVGLRCRIIAQAPHAPGVVHRREIVAGALRPCAVTLVDALVEGLCRRRRRPNVAEGAGVLEQTVDTAGIARGFRGGSRLRFHQEVEDLGSGGNAHVCSHFFSIRFQSRPETMHQLPAAFGRRQRGVDIF